MSTKVYPVIMCGGAGTRMWPLSNKAKPKQYHSIVSEKSMLHETILRLGFAENLDVQAPSFVCATEHENIVREQCKDEGIEPHRLILEPMGRNTAPVATTIARLIQQDDPDALVLLLPADHHIADPQGFWAHVSKGVSMAQDGYLMTLGIQPTGPETGFGYIKTGKPAQENTFTVEAFVEKPDKQTAEMYLSTKKYFWNAGIFLFSASSMLEAFEKCAPDILQSTDVTLGHSKEIGTSLYLDAKHFELCRNESIDYAIMENADKVGIIAPVDIGWNDIGSWAAVRDLLMEKQEPGTTITVGDVVELDCTNSYIRTDGLKVAAIGLDNMIVIATADTILIAPADRAQDVKTIVGKLKATQPDNS
ncbi:MAG: mannose-1-phosphate guanylyltransferase/mannose-6-phosphate isomerase [Robiginitomaculum sp.]|nr:mannose-1-phosphate guanylyltransferase/mannose-6-phosphate isomerase [Robiginitomaculum sp.]